MKRFWLAAVAVLCSFAQLSAQEGTLAPTTPIVPAPVFNNGKLLAPAGGNAWGSGDSKLFSRTTWSPVRNPVVPADGGNFMPAPATGYSPMPPLPQHGGLDGKCGTPGCGTVRDGMSWDRLKAWLCYQPSKSELPKLRPAPYVTPLQGMFPCVSANGCNTGCGTTSGAHYPAMQSPAMPMPGVQPMPKPMPPAIGASPVVMPPRGTAGMVTQPTVQPTWQGRTAPATSGTGIAGYRFATPENRNAAQLPGTVIRTGYSPK
jgi:hypothetical protein